MPLSQPPNIDVFDAFQGLSKVMYSGSKYDQPLCAYRMIYAYNSSIGDGTNPFETAFRAEGLDFKSAMKDIDDLKHSVVPIVQAWVLCLKDVKTLSDQHLFKEGLDSSAREWLSNLDTAVIGTFIIQDDETWQPSTSDREDIKNLSNENVHRAVASHYKGGWAGFLKDYNSKGIDTPTNLVSRPSSRRDKHQDSIER